MSKEDILKSIEQSFQELKDTQKEFLVQPGADQLIAELQGEGLE